MEIWRLHRCVQQMLFMVMCFFDAFSEIYAFHTPWTITDMEHVQDDETPRSGTNKSSREHLSSRGLGAESSGGVVVLITGTEEEVMRAAAWLLLWGVAALAEAVALDASKSFWGAAG